MLPRGQRAEGAVEVDELAQARGRGVGDPVGLRVEADRGDPDVGRLAGQAQVDRARHAVGDDLARRLGVERDADDAREVVAAPAGQHPDGGAGDLAQRPGHGAEHPVAAQRHDHAAALRRADRELARVGDVAGGVDLEGDAEGAQAGLDARQRPGGAPAAGGGIDDEGDLACHVGGHLDHPDSLMKSATSSGRSVIT